MPSGNIEKALDQKLQFASVSPPVKRESWPCYAAHYRTMVEKCGTQCRVSLCAFMCTDVRVSTRVHGQTSAMTSQLMTASNYHLCYIGPFTGCWTVTISTLLTQTFKASLRLARPLKVGVWSGPGNIQGD